MLPLVRLSSINPLCPPVCGRRTHNGTNMEPNEFNLWGDQLQQIHHKNCHVCLSFPPCCSFHLFLSLLIFVILSCRLLFLSSLSGFLSVAAYFGRLCDGPTNTEPSTKISHDLFLEVFWFQFFPRHRAGTWIVTKTWVQYEVKSRFARKSLTWNFQGKCLKNHLGSRLTFKSPFKVADRFVTICSNSMLVVSGCSLGSVWACAGFHVSFFEWFYWKN